MANRPIAGFITVRTSSTRLPAKCLLPFGSVNVLEHVIRRARAFGIEPIVCTSVDHSDNVIEEIASTEGARCFRGSLSNKLKRWSDCATHFCLESFHTVDADDPTFTNDAMFLAQAERFLFSWTVDDTKESLASAASSLAMVETARRSMLSGAVESVENSFMSEC